MRILTTLVLILWSACATAQEWEDTQVFNDAATGPFLRIISSTDTALFAPLITSFVDENPNTRVAYFVTSTADVDRRLRDTPDAFDIVVSSAMDLQLKLVNDGFARQLPGIEHPDWATWRQSLFAFTAEPAAIVINRAAFAGAPIPATRQELIEALRDRPTAFRDKVGTYDVRQSGLGYLFATQDSRASDTYWRLMEVMGRLGVRLYCCSGDMIDDLTTGKIAVAYNVLGSYAAARPEVNDSLAVILPSDFPITMMRTAFVTAATAEASAAESFIAHLLATQAFGQGENLLLPPLTSEDAAEDRATIPLEPALMTFLDALKRRRFLAAWEDTMIQN